VTDEPGDDDAAWVQGVFDASYRRLVAQMYGICGDLGEAEDAVQEAFVRALAGAGRFRRTDNPEAWLRTVALNQLRSRWRRLAVRRRWLARERPEHVAPELSEDHVALVRALQQLPAAQREAIALHHLADLPVGEVAEITGVAPGTVKARLSRGRTALRPLLTDPTEGATHG
jgi:RNA polymerase sigma-70 factor (sigma-E family)